MLAGTEKVEPPPQRGVVDGLAAVTVDRGELSDTINGEGNVEFVVASSDERGAELVVEPAGNLRREGPCHHRDRKRRRGTPRRVSGALMVGVTGYAPVVEDEQLVGGDIEGDTADIAGQLVERLGDEAAIGVVEQLDVAHTEDLAGLFELGGSDRTEVTLDTVEGGRLAVGERQHGDLGAAFGEVGDDRAEAEGLIVRMSAHDEHARRRRQHCVHWAPRAASDNDHGAIGMAEAPRR